MIYPAICTFSDRSSLNFLLRSRSRTKGRAYLLGLSKGFGMNHVDESMLKQAALEGSKLLQSEDAAERAAGFDSIKRAADHGSVPSKAYVGFILRTGSFGVSRDELEAFEYLREAAAADDSFGIEQLAALYFDRKDYAKAISLACKAADLSKENSLAAELAGKMYIEGLGAAQDSMLGMSYLKRAVQNGNFNALPLYAKHLAVGDGCTANPLLAIEVLQTEFERKPSASIAYQLANIYKLPVVSNELQSTSWLNKASDLGSDEAKNELKIIRKKKDIDDLSVFSMGGREYGLYLWTGSIVNIGEKSSTQIQSSGGYGGTPVSVKSHTSRQQVISVLRDDDGLQVDLFPRSDLQVNVGMTVGVICFGLAERVANRVNVNPAYKVALVPAGTNVVLNMLKPEVVLGYTKSLKNIKPWIFMAIASLLLTPFTKLGALIGVGFFCWRSIQMKSENENMQKEVNERINKFAKLLTE